MEKTIDKTIITVVGKDTVGIIAKVCTYLADNGVNILDISQTIVSGFFNMMMKLFPNCRNWIFCCWKQIMISICWKRGCIHIL